MRIPDFTLLRCRQFLELLDTQADSESCESNSPIAPIPDPHSAVKLESVHRAECANAVNLDLGNHGKTPRKKKGRHLGRPANPLRQFIRGRWLMYNRR